MNLPKAQHLRAMLGLVLAGLSCALAVQARTPQPPAASTQAASPAAEPPQGGGCPLGGQRARASVGVDISSAFSPSGSALALVLQAISRAQSSIHVAAYLFTSSDVARALVQARKRGVQVQVLVDWKANFDEGARYARHALGILRNAGIAVRQVDVYPIFHDKYMVIDRRTVQTGSFNYTDSAAHRNAENVLVVWNAPDLAARYLADWQRNWALGQPIKLPY